MATKTTAKKAESKATKATEKESKATAKKATKKATEAQEATATSQAAAEGSVPAAHLPMGTWAKHNGEAIRILDASGAIVNVARYTETGEEQIGEILRETAVFPMTDEEGYEEMRKLAALKEKQQKQQKKQTKPATPPASERYREFLQDTMNATPPVAIRLADGSAFIGHQHLVNDSRLTEVTRVHGHFWRGSEYPPGKAAAEMGFQGDARKAGIFLKPTTEQTKAWVENLPAGEVPPPERSNHRDPLSGAVREATRVLGVDKVRDLLIQAIAGAESHQET